MEGYVAKIGHNLIFIIPRKHSFIGGRPAKRLTTVDPVEGNVLFLSWVRITRINTTFGERTGRLFVCPFSCFHQQAYFHLIVGQKDRQRRSGNRDQKERLNDLKQVVFDLFWKWAGKNEKGIMAKKLNQVGSTGGVSNLHLLPTSPAEKPEGK